MSDNPYKDFRKATGANQEEFSKLIGVTQGYLSMIETGKRIPSKKVHNKYVNLGFNESTSIVYIRKCVVKKIDNLNSIQLLAISDLLDEIISK